MKANEAPKSKFVYPDKLYARANNNITLDISYAPQTLEAVEYTRTDAFIEKAIEWIDKNAFRYIVTRKYQGLDVTGLDTSLAADFKKALEDIL